MSATRRRATRPQGPADPAVCRCRHKPAPIATFRNGALVSVERKHFRLEGCLMGVEKLDPKTYAKT